MARLRLSAVCVPHADHEPAAAPTTARPNAHAAIHGCRTGSVARSRNPTAAVAVNYVAYTLIRIHRTLRVMPALAPGVTDRFCKISDLVAPPEESKSTNAA